MAPRNRTLRAQVVSQLRVLETLCTTQKAPDERAYFEELGRLFDVLAVTLQGTRDSALMLMTVAMFTTRRAESMLGRRIELWRGLEESVPSP